MTINEDHYRAILAAIQGRPPIDLGMAHQEATTVPYSWAPQETPSMYSLLRRRAGDDDWGYWTIVLHFEIAFEREPNTQSALKAIMDDDETTGNRTGSVHLYSWLNAVLDERMSRASDCRLLVVPPESVLSLTLRDPYESMPASQRKGPKPANWEGCTRLRIPAWSCTARGWRFNSLRGVANFNPLPVITELLSDSLQDAASEG